VGVGALNLDLIASASKLSSRLADEQVVETTARFEWNFEDIVDEATIDRVIAGLGLSSIDGALGGSAWNTIYSLAQMRVGVSVGYVGVAGRTEFPGLSFIRQMERLGIDSSFVLRAPERRAGLCLSYIEDGERVLLTNPGANLAMDGYIQREFEAIANYLSEARAVHVTSFLDTASSTQVARLLTAVKHDNPHVILSVDPGHIWASDLASPVRDLLGAADYIFCNHRELKLLGSYERGDTDAALARRAFERIDPSVTLVVAKRYDLVEVFRKDESRMVMVTSPSSSARPLDSDIEDATGAGDSFAAGLLSALTSSSLKTDLGTLVGLALSRYKRSGATLTSEPLVPSLDRGFLLFPGLTNVAKAPPPGVFLARGSSPEWTAVHDFLRNDCRLSVESAEDALESGPDGDVPAITRHIDNCGFAVCILVDDEGRSEVTAANQRVLQLAGIFQGRYGFERVAMVVEEGCDVLSNVAGIIRLDYPRGDIRHVFWQMRQMLHREGLI
jgi:sugar/nucleoside kinase (ribokinase family)